MDEDNVDMDQEESDDDEDDDKLEEVGSSSRARPHPCQFCGESFTSELGLILHFREKHLDPDEDSSEEEEEEEENESKEADVDSDDVNPSMMDFLTDCERALLREQVFIPSESKAEVEMDPEDDEIDKEPEVGVGDDELTQFFKSTRDWSANVPCETAEEQDENSPVVLEKGRANKQMSNITSKKSSLSSTNDKSKSKPPPSKRTLPPRKRSQPSTTASCDKRQMTRRLLPLLGTPEKVAPKNTKGEMRKARSPEVIDIQVSSKSSLVKTQKGDPREDRTPRKPSLTTKAAAGKPIDKRKGSRRLKGPFDCVFCGKSYSRSYNLNNHIRSHIEERPYFCKLCDDSFAVSGDLKAHIRLNHLRVTPFKCEVCSESFPNRTTLKHHMTTHSAERKFECEHCKMRFRHLTYLTRHLQCHIGNLLAYECDTCMKGFTRPETLRRHRRDVHNIAHTVVKKLENFECKHCQKRFIRKTELNTHMISAHNIAVRRATTTAHDPKKEKKFECEYCKTRFVQKKDMNKHVRMFHPSAVQGSQTVAASKGLVTSTAS